MEKHEKVQKLEEAKAHLEEAVQLASDALEGDANADAYFLATLREVTGYGGNPYNQTIDTMIERVVQDDPPDVEA